MDKHIESAMNELLNAEIWSTNLYLSLQVYFEEQQYPILASWLGTQAQGNINRIYQMMDRIYHYGGCVTINELKRDTQTWKTPLTAMNELLNHERYMSEQITNLLTLCQQMDLSFHDFVNQMYASRIYMSTVFLELLRILAQEGERRLPCFLQ